MTPEGEAQLLLHAAEIKANTDHAVRVSKGTNALLLLNAFLLAIVMICLVARTVRR